MTQGFNPAVLFNAYKDSQPPHAACSTPWLLSQWKLDGYFCCFSVLFVFELLNLLYLLLIRSYSLCTSFSHYCEEPGPSVPDSILAGMKGLQSGTSETALLQAEVTQAPPASPPRACAPASWPPWWSLCWACCQFMFFLDQGPKNRYSILDTAR